MPEGDTIFRTAQTLNLALAGRTVTRFVSDYPALTRIDEDAPIVGRAIVRVESRGKHLLLHVGPAVEPATAYAGPLALRSHMRMSGSWHLYRPGERWAESRARIRMETDTWIAAAFGVHDVEWLDARALARHPALRALGPDLLADDFDEDAALTRLRQLGDTPIADALLDQRALAGIGNVYKSETLFLERLHPATRVSDITDDALKALVARATRLLTINAQGSGPGLETYRGLRKTTDRSHPAERLWVYSRGGRPCRRCGARISFARIGRDVRGTYWCPSCQPDRT